MSLANAYAASLLPPRPLTSTMPSGILQPPSPSTRRPRRALRAYGMLRKAPQRCSHCCLSGVVLPALHGVEFVHVPSSCTIRDNTLLGTPACPHGTTSRDSVSRSGAQRGRQESCGTSAGTSLTANLYGPTPPCCWHTRQSPPCARTSVRAALLAYGLSLRSRTVQSSLGS